MSVLEATDIEMNLVLRKHMAQQIEVLKLRKNLSIKNMGIIVNKSATMKGFLTISMDVLNDINSKSLWKTARELVIVNERYKPEKDVWYWSTKKEG